jgi:hypothetical protein
MARALGIIRHGTARNLADHDDGYSANGESEFSRQSARAPNVSLNKGRRTDGRLIRETEKALRKLKCKASEVDDPIRLMKLEKNIAIKSAFLDRLRPPRITTIPGELDASWD